MGDKEQEAMDFMNELLGSIAEGGHSTEQEEDEDYVLASYVSLPTLSYLTNDDFYGRNPEEVLANKINEVIRCINERGQRRNGSPAMG